MKYPYKGELRFVQHDYTSWTHDFLTEAAIGIKRRIAGLQVSYSPAYYLRDDPVFMAWVRQYVSGRYIVQHQRISFEQSEDAAMFKLVWGSMSHPRIEAPKKRANKSWANVA